jgi:uracil-DNA glycosylase family 4
MPLTNKKTGLKLRIFLHKAGIDPFSVFITNVVKCNVGRDQLRLSFESLGVVCRDYLEQEITIIKPRAILTLGTNVKKVVTQMVTKKKQLESLHLITSEVISGQPPFLGEFSSGVQAEIFHLRHPSWVEGPRREANYVKNLEIIKNHLKV